VPTTIHDPERVTYDVSAPTLAEAARLIAEMDEAGRAEWWPHLDYDTEAGVLSAVTVTVPTRITMPRWPEYTSAAQACREEWDRFWVALDHHEQGHIALVRQHLDGLHRRLRGLPESEAAQAWEDALGALNQASESYDAQTDHGRNQGTVIDASVGADPD
jgi:predicted secreted Zn-dependent protease